MAQRGVRMGATMLEGETDRSPSRGPWSKPLRFMDAVRPGFPHRRVLMFGTGSDITFPVVPREMVFLEKHFAGKLLFEDFTTAAIAALQDFGWEEASNMITE